VAVVPRRYDHGIDLRICKQRLRVARGYTKTELAPTVSGGHATGAGDPKQLCSGVCKRRMSTRLA